MNLRKSLCVFAVLGMLLAGCSAGSGEAVSLDQSANGGPGGKCNSKRDSHLGSPQVSLSSVHWTSVSMANITVEKARGDELTEIGLDGVDFVVHRDDAKLLKKLRVDQDQPILVIANSDGTRIATTFVVYGDEDFYFVDPCDDDYLGRAIREFADTSGTESSNSEVLFAVTLGGDSELRREFYGVQTEPEDSDTEWHRLDPNNRSLNAADAPIEVVESLHAVDAVIKVKRANVDTDSMVCFLTDLGWTSECLPLDVLVNGTARSSSYDVVIDVPSFGQVRVFVGSTDASFRELIDTGESVSARDLIDAKGRGNKKLRVDLRETAERLEIVDVDVSSE